MAFHANVVAIGGDAFVRHRIQIVVRAVDAPHIEGGAGLPAIAQARPGADVLQPVFFVEGGELRPVEPAAAEGELLRHEPVRRRVEIERKGLGVGEFHRPLVSLQARPGAIGQLVRSLGFEPQAQRANLGRPGGGLLVLEAMAKRQKSIRLVREAQRAVELKDVPVQIQSRRNAQILRVEPVVGLVVVMHARKAIGQRQFQLVRHAPRNGRPQLVDVALKVQGVAVLDHLPRQTRGFDVGGMPVEVVERPEALNDFDQRAPPVAIAQDKVVAVGPEVPVLLVGVFALRIKQITPEREAIGFRRRTETQAQLGLEERVCDGIESILVYVRIVGEIQIQVGAEHPRSKTDAIARPAEGIARQGQKHKCAQLAREMYTRVHFAS